MILIDEDTRLELSLVGYESPEVADEKHGANWLEVALHLRHPQGTHSATQASLLTWEAGWLAMWLDNLARDVPQSVRLNAIEPDLRFEHVRTERDRVHLRVRLASRFVPPWGDHRMPYTIEFAALRAQLSEAAASLWAELAHFPPRAGAETRPPFVPPVLSPTCFVDGALSVPVATDEEAISVVTAYMEGMGLTPTVQETWVLPQREGHRVVRVVADVWSQGNDPFHALFRLLAVIPLPWGAPRVSHPQLRPDGAFECRVWIDPTRERTKEPFSRLRGSLVLTNWEHEDRFWLETHGHR